MHSLEKNAFELLMNFWNTYVNESKGCIIQPQNINKAPVTHHSLLVSRTKQSFRPRLALEKTSSFLAEHKTIIIF